MVASFLDPDVFRLLVLPLLAYAGYRDVETRRVPNWVWVVIAGGAVVLLAWDAYRYLDWISALQLLALKTALSIFFVGGIAYVFWHLGAFGGADAKAFIALSLLFPAFPTYHINDLYLPVHETAVGVFSLTILTNTVVLGLGIPLVLLVKNTLNSGFQKAGAFAYPISVSRLPTVHGAILSTHNHHDTPELTTRADIDVITEFFDWRNLTLHEFLHNNGDTTPTDTDPYGVKSFYEETDVPKYGTTEDELVAVLHTLSTKDETDTVWLSPGLPFIAILFFGTVTALVYGDIMYAALNAIL